MTNFTLPSNLSEQAIAQVLAKLDKPTPEILELLFPQLTIPDAEKLIEKSQKEYDD